MNTSLPRLAARGIAVCGVLATCVPVTALRAQTASPDATPAAAIERRQVLSVQPIVGMLGLLSFDYERAVRGGFTLGVGGSYLSEGTLNLGDLANFTYASAELKGRFYPGGRPLHGFSVGLTAGGARAAYDDDFDFDSTRARVVAHGVKVGTELDYNWIVGRRQRVALAAGIGGKRVFYQNVAGTRGRLTGGYPTSRIAIGYAF